MQAKLATLTTLEWLARLARRLGLGAIVDRLAPIVSRPFERFMLDVDGVQLGGTDLAQLHYVRELRELGREQTFVRLLAEAIPSGAVVVEGGAHLGFVTVHEARAVGPNGRVVVFEPNSDVLGVLRGNLLVNGVEERVEIVPKALGDSTGSARFFVRADESSLYEPISGADSIDIDVVRADELIEGPVDVVKLDIEGAEPAALRGMEGPPGRGRGTRRALPRMQSRTARARRILARRVGRLAPCAPTSSSGSTRRMGARSRCQSRGQSRTSTSAARGLDGPPFQK